MSVSLEKNLNKYQLSPATVYGLESYSKRDPKNMAFPWSGRDADQWTRIVTKPEALRLMHLALGRPFDPGTAYDRFTQNDLVTPFKVYWNGNISALADDLPSIDDNTTDRDRPVNREITPELTKLFSDRKLYPYALASRIALKEKRQLVANRSLPNDFSLLDRRTELLGPGDFTAQTESFATLINLFYKEAMRQASFRSAKIRHSLEDWEGIAGLKLVAAVNSFYWETAFLNPGWTVGRFLQSFTSSLQDDASQVFDTRTLEVRTPAMINYASKSSPEQDAIFRQSGQEVRKLISGFSSSPEVATALAMRINYLSSYVEISTLTGLSPNEVDKNIDAFRKYVQAESSAGRVSFAIPEKAAPDLWNGFIRDIEVHKQRFKNKSETLTPFYQKLLQLFFELQDGNKKSTIEKVTAAMQEDGHNVALDTVRRNIYKALNILSNKEAINYKHGLAKLGARDRQRQLVIQASQDTGYWEGIPDQTRQILNMFFITPSEPLMTQAEVAVKLGINASTVSRVIDKAIRGIYRHMGNPSHRPELASKPRNNLPQ